MTFETYLNLVIVALLALGIIYAVVLEYRLSSVKENHRNLALLIKQFYDASHKAQKELIKLKNLEEQSRQELKKDIEKAALVRDEIKYLLNKTEQAKSIDAYASSDASLFSFSSDSNLSRTEEELIRKLNEIK